MKQRLITLWSAMFVLLTGTAYAATKVVANGCPPCPFCR